MIGFFCWAGFANGAQLAHAYSRNAHLHYRWNFPCVGSFVFSSPLEPCQVDRPGNGGSMRRDVSRWLTCCAGLLIATALTIPGTQRTSAADSREPTIHTQRPINWLPTKRGKC